MADITINGITIDPLEPTAQLASVGPFKSAAVELPVTDTDYVLVQVDGPLTGARRAELAALGLSVLEYVPHDAYIGRYPPADLAPIRALPYVHWAGPYLRGLKLSAALSAVGPVRLSLAAAAAGPVKTLSDAPATVDVVFHQEVADPGAAAARVAAAAALDPADVVARGNKVRLTTTVSRLAQLAEIDEVRTIEPVIPVKLHNDVARAILRVDRPNPGPLPFEGDGQIVAVADTGFDKGSTTGVHPAFSGRVLRLYPLGRPGKSNDPHGHGTHVAGSVLGDGRLAPTSAPVRGTAPRARLVLQSLLDAGGGLGGLPADLRDLFAAPHGDGARVHTNSWGSTLGDGRYDAQAFEVDDYVWTHRDLVICFAAGNEGVDADADGVVDPRSLTPPGTAKNCITVGASENDRPQFGVTYGQGWPQQFPAMPLSTDRLANDRDGMVAFSSRGPTLDRRFKPDVVAPGTFVLSTRSRDTSSTGWGASTDPLYMYLGGTSMATPLVAGCCALVREYLGRERGHDAPSAALVKALLVNGAVDIPGQYAPSEAATVPNFAEGFGRVDMDATVGRGAAAIALLEDEGDALDTGEARAWTLAIPAGAGALKATLVWTDPPGATLQNDLDLIVRHAGEERHGNVAPGAAGFDRSNNVEQVLWSSPPAGEAQLVVRAHRIARFPQSFALVVRIG